MRFSFEVTLNRKSYKAGYRRGRKNAREELKPVLDVLGSENMRMSQILDSIGLGGAWKDEAWHKLQRIPELKQK